MILINLQTNANTSMSIHNKNTHNLDERIYLKGFVNKLQYNVAFVIYQLVFGIICIWVHKKSGTSCQTQS